jgi:hypothetical protein
MHNLRYGLLAARTLIFVLALTGMSRPSRAQGEEIIFSCTGDVPYGKSEASVFEKQIVKHNKYSPSAFFVHVGDILVGGCDESKYAQVASMMKDLSVPAYIVPGDNETLDCNKPAEGLNAFMKYFTNFEQNFCRTPYTARQKARPENWAFTKNGVLFIGVNLVYGGSIPRQRAAEWVQQQFEAKAAEVRAAAIFSHFEPNYSSQFSTPFRRAAEAFGKPILFLHGHGHSWSEKYPFPEKNILRVQVNNGADEDPVQVTVTMNTERPSTAFIFKRKPWSGKNIVNMPPCPNAGPDQEIYSLTTILEGWASDDGDPDRTLITTWRKFTGPGRVTFGDANALKTTARFSVPGIYVLRLHVDDTELQARDGMRIVVHGSGSHAKLAIDDGSDSTTTAAGGSTTLEGRMPEEFILEQNYPNPFNPDTQIRFGLPQESYMTIKVYTINGAEIRTLVDAHYPAGVHDITFNAENLPSGTYFYVMQAGEVRLVRRLMLVK